MGGNLYRFKAHITLQYGVEQTNKWNEDSVEQAAEGLKELQKAFVLNLRL